MRSLFYLFPLLLIAFFSFTGCQQNIDPALSDNNGPLIKKFVRLHKNRPQFQDTLYSLNFYYDNQGRIIKIIERENDSLTFQILYISTVNLQYQNNNNYPIKGERINVSFENNTIAYQSNSIHHLKYNNQGKVDEQRIHAANTLYGNTIYDSTLHIYTYNGSQTNIVRTSLDPGNPFNSNHYIKSTIVGENYTFEKDSIYPSNGLNVYVDSVKYTNINNPFKVLRFLPESFITYFSFISHEYCYQSYLGKSKNLFSTFRRYVKDDFNNVLNLGEAFVGSFQHNSHNYPVSGDVLNSIYGVLNREEKWVFIY